MRQNRRLCILIFALLLLSLLTACGGGKGKAVFEFTRDGYRDPTDGKTYVMAEDAYRSVSYSEKNLVGTYTSRGGTVTTFYRMDGAEGYLTDADHQIYLPDGATLPAFSDMEIATLSVCKTGTVTITIGVIDDPATVASVVRAYTAGPSVPYSKVARSAERYDLIFAEENPVLTYQLIYLEFDGEVVVYEPLNSDGSVPDIYPGVTGTAETVSGETVAVFRFGSQLLYDRDAGKCYPVVRLTD